MTIPISIPRLGWSMEEGTFLGWLKQDGDAVRAGEAIFRLESDKATEDIECLDSGVLHIGADSPKEGDKVPVGMVIGHLKSDLPVDDREVPIGKAAPALIQNPSPSPAKTRQSPGADRKSPTASPRARRLAAECGVDWTELEGSGRSQRIRAQDVQRAASLGEPRIEEKIVALTSVRRTGVERLIHSRQITVPVTLTTTGAVTNLLALRRQFQATTTSDSPTYGGGAAGGYPSPSLTDFFVKLTAQALMRHPLLAARWSEDHLIQASAINIGIAVDTPAGLVVPVLYDVPSLSIGQLASKSHDLIERARQGKLRAQDIQGGVFTVTNLGMFGIDAFTPVINHPECAILGMGRIQRVPVLVDDEIVAQDQITLSLTFDHRIVDGAPAARFLQDLVRTIESPGLWLMP